MDTAISFLTPFAAFVAAEEIHASGVISVVVAGLLLGHKAPIIQTAQSRITERITWRTVAFVLENTVFLLIGLQLDWILAGRPRVEPAQRPHRARLPRDPADRRRRTPRLHAGHRLPPAARPHPGVVELPHRLGRDARRRHARRGVRDPRGRTPPRGAAPRRVHRRGRHPARAGPDAAADDPAARRARPRPGRGRPRPRRPAPAGRGRRLRAPRRAGVRRPPRGGRSGAGPRRPAHLRGVGAAGHHRRRGDARRSSTPGSGAR